MRRLGVAFMMAVLGIVLLGCPEEKGPLEKAGEKLDQAAEDLGDAVEEAAEELEE